LNENTTAKASTLNLERELKRFVRQIRPGLIGATSNPNRNLNQLIEELKISQPRREELASRLEEFLGSRDFVTALTETGLTLETNVFSEIFKRIEYKFLPKPVDNADILNFLDRVFDAQSDRAWLEKINHERFGEFLAMILPSRERLIESLSPQFFMSLEILSLRLAGLGYDPVVTQRLREQPKFQHAYMYVTRQVHSLLDSKGEAAIPGIRDSLLRCAESVRWIRTRRSVDGASLALTYRLMKIQQIVRRMTLLLDLIEAMLGEWSPEPALELFFEIIMAEISRFNVGRFIGENVELLAYQVTEHTGKAGEHYITRTRSEWNGMFKSAAIAGVIAGVFSIIKLAVGGLHLAAVPEAFAFGVVYSTCFLLIRYVGGTIATKQPAMTASTLAGSLDDAKNSQQAMENLTEMIVRTVRSQMVALLGNYLLAFPIAAAISFLLIQAHIPIVKHEKAVLVIESLHPFRSLSFFYAAVAGVGLFLSGLLAGMADNWFVFNHVASRLKNSQILINLVGHHGLDKAIHKIDRSVGFWTGDCSLGFYLGCMADVGLILGLPLDTRHITFASGQFGAVVPVLGTQLPWTLLLTLALTIFGFGLVNLTVSFSLTLFVVVRSRKIRFSQTPELLRMLARRFRARPMEFFVPQPDFRVAGAGPG
jgi:site-specific recombinase